MKPSFFNAARDFRAWLHAHHTTHTELVVGFYKRGSGKGGLTYAEALDEALCFGWIDGLRKSIDAASYTIRFTPRQSRSIWSRVNLGHIERLQKSGRLMPAGLKVFQARDPAKCGIYSFENAARKLAPTDEQKFKADKKARAYFEQQAPWYRRTAVWWVVSAKKEETRARRFTQLLKDSAAGRRIAQLARTK